MKRKLTCWWVAVSVVAFAIPTFNVVWARQPWQSLSQNFEVGAAFGERDAFSFEAGETGCILAWISLWEPSNSGENKADQLALILNGSDREKAYARVDGTASSALPLQLSYAVSSRDADRVNTWTISVVNFTERGTAQGKIRIEYPPADIPCEFRAVSRGGQANLSWRYARAPFSGDFFVERSNDGSSWSPVQSCQQAGSDSVTYSCQDSDVQRGHRYYYRICASLDSTSCASNVAAPLIRVTVR